MDTSRFSSHVPHARQLKLQTPSLLRRMACWLYEGILLFGVVFVAGYVFTSLSQTRDIMVQRHILQILIFGVLGGYFVWFWGHGQTLAMKTWKIRLVDRRGYAVSYKRAFVRYCFTWVWFLPPLFLFSVVRFTPLEQVTFSLLWLALWAASSYLQKERQFWHDVWAGTRLVHSEPVSRE